MSRLKQIAFRLRGFFRKEKLDADMAEEMRLHLELRTQRNIEAGMPPKEARYAAQRGFGGVEQVKELCREERGSAWFDQWMTDIRFSLRSLRRAPGFTVAIVSTLALGIGAATAVCNLTAGPLFLRAEYPNASELLAIGWKDKWNSLGLDLSGLQFLSYQEQTKVFAAYAAIEGRIANVVVDGEPAPANHVAISADSFRTLGIAPVLGRGFLPEEYHDGRDDIVVITDAFWRSRLNADASVLGRKILIDRLPCKVIGVLRAGQQIPFRFQGDVYRPLAFRLGPQNRFGPSIHVVGRLRKGVSQEEACAALTSVRFPSLSPTEVSSISSRKPVVLPINERDGRAIWWVLFAAGMVLFAISCLNAMNLMLVRMLGRTRELGVRIAIGCSRSQIARLLLIESAGLTLASGLVVLFVARWWFQPLFAFLYGNPAVRYEVFADWVTVGSAAVMCLVASGAVVFATIRQVSKTEAIEALKAGGAAAGETRGIGRRRNSFVALQAALAVVLLVGTGLMMRTVQRLHAVDLGFDPAGRVKVWLIFPSGFAPKLPARLEYFERLRQRVAAIPGVKSVSFGQDALLVGGFWAWENFQIKDGTFQWVAVSHLSAGYGETAGMKLKRGRWFSGRQGEWEVVINETLARARFGDDDPIGQSIKIRDSGDRECQVVGVVRDVKETLRAPAGLRFYVPDWMAPASIGALLLRLDRDPGPEFKGVVRRAIHDFDPTVITNYVGSIQEVMGNSLWAERFVFLILRGLAVIALGLAIVGLFSVMAYSVGARTKEFGVRLALGAKPVHLHQLVLTRGVATVGTGVLVGTAAAFALTRFMQSLLFETGPHEPSVYVAVAGALLASAFVACWLPAHRAATIDPMIALRSE